jgi:4-hydroxybenzoate polyprenyltransferase
VRYPRPIPDLTRIVRAGEWWEYKLAPIFAAFYATALTLDAPVSSLWRSLLITLLALVPGAAYVSVINDLTDREDDLAGGKPNRFANRPRWLGVLLAAVTAGAGVVFCILWRNDPFLVAIYLCAWAAFSLYSLPPFRFKTRGILGVLCDAGGAHLFPTLVAVLLAFRGAERAPDALWLASIGTWAFANGVRGILWHQLTDVENDRRAGVRTFASRHSAETAIRIGTYIAFPLELLALGSMIVRMRSWWPIGFLIAYAVLVYLRVLRWHNRIVIVAPKERFLIAMHEYYDAFLPLSILIASARTHPYDWIVLAVHAVIFPTRVWQVLNDIAKLWRERHYKSDW